MNASRLIRQFHRWISILFTVGVTANITEIFGLKHPQPTAWVGMMALIPLILLMVTGLYMFALPYFRRSVGDAA